MPDSSRSRNFIRNGALFFASNKGRLGTCFVLSKLTVQGRSEGLMATTIRSVALARRSGGVFIKFELPEECRLDGSTATQIRRHILNAKIPYDRTDLVSEIWLSNRRYH